MRTVTMLAMAALWAAPGAARGQVSLHAGEVFVYEFQVLPRTGGATSGSEFATFAFQVTHAAGQPGATLSYEMFEGGPSGVPLCSGTLSAPSQVGACTVPMAWRDLQGSVRFRAMSGAMRIDHVLFRVQRQEGSGYGVYYTEFDLPAEPRLSIAHAGVAQVQLTWRTNFASYELQGTESLSQPSWMAVTNSVSVVGPFHRVTVNKGLAQRAFRLRRR